MIYAIDFDGTIVEDAFPEIGKLKPEAEQFIRDIQRRGDKWILWTMRAGLYLNVAEEFLYKHSLIPDAVNDNLPEVKAKWPDNPNPRKIFADVYIDDRNAGGLKWQWPYWPADTIEQTIPEWWDGDNMSNAYLISAAPEMYAELSDLLDAMESGLFPQVAPGVDYPAVMEKKWELQKLLKKARGEK